MSVLAQNTDLGKKFSQKRFWARHTRIWERIWDRYMCISSASHKVADSQENKEVAYEEEGYNILLEKYPEAGTAQHHRALQ